MTSFTVLVRAEQRLVDLVAALPRDAYRRPTPCTDWDVAALLSHTLTGIEVFASAADGLPGPTAEEMFGGSDLLAGDPAAATARAVARSQAAWRDVQDAETMLTTILGPLPAGLTLSISGFATLVHTWDLAVATGQPFADLPADLLAHVDEVARAVVPGLRAEGEGHALFQPEVVPAADATATERLMAFMGRSVG